ncbi:Retrovirus-related Pol polyprotein from transposon 297 [Vitis vinifera]|uniref:Retrovirus-related Pol polyprotein from transposon 297 n=1 Tax=Vitis vinifera TaxID=29760 RepID=A0A438HNL3_VITVI|nr:Retrovirus-related Pol polyprotein from transposon 297 [Vitis vinifera]
MESENPYTHIKEFEDVCNTFQEGGASIDLMRLKLFPFTLKDKAKIWLNSLSPRSIRTWTDLQAEFLKKFFPTHRTNGLKRQISNFSAKENEKFYECWERYMEAINACPHHGFDTWLLVSYFYDGMSFSMKQLLETMCGGDFMSKNPEEAMDFLSYVAEVSRGWDEPHRGEVGKMKSQPSAFNAKARMYTLNEDDDMKANCAETPVQAVAETPVQAVAETPVQVKLCPICQSYEHLMEECPTIPTVKEMFGDQANVDGQFRPNNNAPYGNTYNSSWRNLPNFSWKAGAPQYQQLAQPSQQSSSLEQAIVNLSKIDNLQYSISRLTNLNTVQEKGRFPSQPHQNPKGIHEVETHEENLHSHDWRKVVEKALLDLGASVNLLPYSVYKQLGLGELKPTSITLSLADRLVKIPRGVIEDVLVQVDNFYYPVDFVVLDTDPTVKEANSVPIILGRSFLATSNAIINCRNGLMQLTFGNMTLELNIFHMSKKQITPEEEEGPEEVCIIDTLVEEHYNQNMLEEERKILPLFNKEEGEATEEETPKLNLKPLLVELKYAYLEENNQCPVVISSSLTSHKEISLLEVLKSPWVSLTQVVPKKSGITVVQNEKREEIATRLTSGWRVLERVSSHHFYCFLDGYSGYFQIEIDVEDQENTTFTCPFGTYAYRRMPFGLCNAPATFQRSVLKRCIEKTWCSTGRKCHFMVRQGIVLGHIISEKGIEIDKAKVELIAKLSSPTTVKGVRQFLGHAGFYRRFIQDFSKLSRPICELLAKNANDFAIGVVLGQREYGKALHDLLCKQNIEQGSKKLYNYRERIVSCGVCFRQVSCLFDQRQERVENVVADHLSRKLLGMLIFANYLVIGEVPSEWKAQDRKHFFGKIHAYYWEEPFLFKYCADQIIRKCVPKEEQQGSSAIAMRMHVEATLPLRKHP